MGGFGFIQDSADKESEKELKTLKDIQMFLETEIRSCKEFEEELMLEFKKIKDIENNFEVINSQMDSIRKLSEERNKIINILVIEKEKE